MPIPSHTVKESKNTPNDYNSTNIGIIKWNYWIKEDLKKNTSPLMNEVGIGQQSIFQNREKLGKLFSEVAFFDSF